jgi:hypothetical protein
MIDTALIFEYALAIQGQRPRLWFFLHFGSFPTIQNLLNVTFHLGIIPFVSLALKAYSSMLVIWIEKGFPAIFTFRLADVEPWGGQQTGISILLIAILYGPVLLFVFGRKAWCRYLCPIGALLKVF